MNEQPASKQDLQELKVELKQELKVELKQELQQLKLELKQDLRELKQEMHERETRNLEALTELMRDIETRLLTSFHGYGKGQAARMHTLESTQNDVGIRIAALEDRVLNLETGHGPRQH